MNKKEIKRLFIAIDLPQGARKKIKDATGISFSGLKGIKPIPEKNIHITIKFLGNTELKKIADIKENIKKAVADIRPFNFNIKKRLGAFPNPYRARVVFAEIEDSANNMEKIFNKIEEKLKDLKIKKEKRKFIPHATVARLKKRKNISGILEKVEVEGIPEIYCDKVLLYESVLKPSGAEYFVIGEFKL